MMDIDYSEFDGTKNVQRKLNDSQIFCGNENYFKGFIIRIDELENLKINLKLYARYVGK